MDVRLTNGVVVKDLHENATQADAIAKARKDGLLKPQADASLTAPLMQGLTFGWADELGGLGARLGGWAAGADESRRDQLAVRETANQRDVLSATRSNNPWASTALELGGALVSGAPAAKLAKSGLGLLGLGIGEGALAGAGAAEENKAAGAALGGFGGGVMAGAVPAIGYLGRRGGNWLSDTVSPMIDRFRQAPSTRAGKILGEQLQGAGITPAQLRSRMRQLGPDATVAEAAGEAGIALGQGVIGKDPTGKARLMAARNLGARVPGMSDRLRETVAKTTGVSERLQPSLDAVRSRQLAISKPLYEKAYSQEIPLTEKLKSILMRSPMKAAFREAKESAEIVGDELPPWFKMNDLGEWEKAGSLPDMRAWDRMKQGIDRLIAKETDDITGRMTPKGRDLTILKRQLVDELDEINPDYQAARRAFAGDEALQQAMRSGEKFLGMKTRDVHEAVRRMSESEKEAFLTGAVESIREKIGRARSGEMGTFKFLETDNAMEKLRAVFPKGRKGDRALAELGRSLRKERTLRETENALVRGSQTQLRQAATEALGGQASLPTGAEVLNSPVSAGVQRMAGEAMQALGRERQPTIDALAELLFTSGNANQAIAELQKRGVSPQVIQQYINKFSVGSAAFAPAAGLLGGNVAR